MTKWHDLFVEAFTMFKGKVSGEFTKLLEAAKQQDQPQRLLMLFARAEGNKKKKENRLEYK